MINVKDAPYLAIGDGLTDDTAAIQLAINDAWAVGTNVYIPSGNYLISSSLNMPFSSVSLTRGNYISGEGSGSVLTAIAPNLKIFNFVQPLTGMTFNQLQMYSNNTHIARYGIYLNATSSLIGQVRVNSVKLRASSLNNPYTAFYAVGANALTSTIVLDSMQTRWDTTPVAGQVTASGWTMV